MRFFREIITVFAGLIAVLLAAALAGPYFVDWNKHKPAIVDALQHATGARFVVAGGIDLKLLPIPRLRLGRVSISGHQPDAAKLAADSLQMEIGLTALLRGQFRIVEAALERPRIDISMQPDGAFLLPRIPRKRAGQIVFENIALRNADVRINRGPGQRPLHLTGVNLKALGQTLQGPFRGAGSFKAGAVTIAYSFNTGTLEGDSLRTKFVIEAIGPLSRGEFDGRLRFASGVTGGRVLSFEGAAGFSGQIALPGDVKQDWSARGPLMVNASGVKADTFEVRSGEDERAVTAIGSFNARFAMQRGAPAGSIQLQLMAHRINVDAMFAGDGGPQQALGRFVRGLTMLTSRRHILPELPVTASVDLKTAAMTAGGETLSDVSLQARLVPGKPIALQLKTGAPGSTSLDLKGVLETGIAPLFRGTAKFVTRDMRRLENWLGPALPKAGRIMSALPYRSFTLSSMAEISKGGLSARNLKFETGRSKFDGAVVYTAAVGKERGLLHIDLVSPALDIDGLGDLSAPARALGDIDLSVAFDARATRLARFGKGIVDAGNIVVRMERKAGKLHVSQFDIKNLGGADVTATASLANGKAHADIMLDAKNLIQLSHLFRRIAPGPISQALATRAAALSPAKLKLQLRGTSVRAGGKTSGGKTSGGKQGSERLIITSLDLDGAVNGTSVQVRSSSNKARLGVSGALSLKASQSAVLLRQLGLEALSVSGLAGSTIEASWKNANSAAASAGAKSGRSAVTLKADLAGTRFSFQGETRALLPAPDVRGKLSVESKDAAPLMQLLAFALPNLSARAPLDMSADFAWKGQRLSAGSLNGNLLGSKATGHFVFAPHTIGKDLSRYVFKGDMRFDRIALRGLTALVFGPDAGGDSVWRTSPFRSASGDFPSSEIIVQTGRFDLPGGAAGKSARFVMRVSPGLLVLDKLEMTAGKTELSGKLTFRKDKETAAVSGSLAFRAPHLGLRSISGRANGKIDFAATGNSERALVAGLAGKGSATVKQLTIDAADTRAMQRVLKATDAERLELTESGVRAALRKNFASAPLRFDQKSFSITIAGGAARLATAPVRDLPGAVDGDLSATFDLRALQGLAKLNLVARKRPKDWNGALPAVGLERLLQSDAAKASGGSTVVRAAGFVNGVSARAIIREVARMEALEFDIRERAYFSRRVKAAAFLVQRRAEIKEYNIEQARLAEEARKRAEEVARREAEEEARRKAAEEKRLLEEERKRKAEEARKQAAEARKQAIAVKVAERKRAAAKRAAQQARAARLARIKARREAEKRARQLLFKVDPEAGGLPIRQVAPAGSPAQQ